MFLDFGQLEAAIKAAKKLAFDAGVPYFLYGSTDKNRPGYFVDDKLPQGCKVWSRFWPDGKTDNYMTPPKGAPKH